MRSTIQTVENKKIVTLCIVHQDDRVLLGMKKRGFGEGKWNGFGGKVDRNENITKAAQRELQEEAGIAMVKGLKLGVLTFVYQNEPSEIETHVYKALAYTGNICESEEMKPQWFHIHKIPFQSMWPDDAFWMPLFLDNTPFQGKYIFGENNEILSSELKVAHEVEEHI